MAKRIDSRDTLHAVHGYGQPLGVECRSCARRGEAFAGEIDEMRGNMRELRTLRFICSRCGSRDWQGYLLLNADDRHRFLSHLPPTGPAFR